MNRLTKPQIASSFQEEILAWYDKHKRDLPWRRTRDPYHILVSEVMLQQTQVLRVIPKYEAWIKKFPTIKHLAKASLYDVLHAWNGLGYNRRALNLHKAAKVIVGKRVSGVSKVSEVSEAIDQSAPDTPDTPGTLDTLQRGAKESQATQFPQSIEELKRLPGIGEYTARAIACFAFDEQVAVVDTNVRKALFIEFFHKSKLASEYSEYSVSQRNQKISNIRLSDVSAYPKRRKSEFSESSGKEIQGIADQLLPKGRAYEWNQALMDYAVAMLRKERIPIPKQSRFKGSNRYYRGKLIRLLLTEKVILLSNLPEKLTDDSRVFDHKEALELVKNLAKEGFLTLEKNVLTLKIS